MSQIKISDFQSESQLIRYLYEEGIIKQICLECQNTGEYNHKLINLLVVRKNGNLEDLSPNNLEVLCPNCYSQKHNYQPFNYFQKQKNNQEIEEKKESQKSLETITSSDCKQYYLITKCCICGNRLGKNISCKTTDPKKKCYCQKHRSLMFDFNIHEQLVERESDIWNDYDFQKTEELKKSQEDFDNLLDLDEIEELKSHIINDEENFRRFRKNKNKNLFRQPIDQFNEIDTQEEEELKLKNQEIIPLSGDKLNLYNQNSHEFLKNLSLTIEDTTNLDQNNISEERKSHKKVKENNSSEEEENSSQSEGENSSQSEGENSSQSEEENSNQSEEENSNQSEEENSNQSEEENSSQSEEENSNQSEEENFS